MDSTAKTRRTVFVIMPFVETPTRDQDQLESFFLHNLKKPIEAADLRYEYGVHRSAEAFDITAQIIKDLFGADIVIADLSGVQPNPNVMYELGVRLALSAAPVILIREEHAQNRRIFDIDHFYIHAYDPYDYAPLEEHLVEKIARLESGEEHYESPVRAILRVELALRETSGVELSAEQQREIVLRGVRTAADQLSKAYGPHGTGRVIESAGGHILATRGDDIACTLQSPNALEMRGLTLMAALARDVQEQVGDGSKTAVIIASATVSRAHAAIRAALLPNAVARGIRRAAQAAAKAIEGIAADGARLGRILNAYSNLLDVDLVEKVLAETDAHSAIHLQEGDTGSVDRFEVKRAFCIERGPSTRLSERPTLLKNCKLLLHDGQLRDMSGMVPLLEALARAKAPAVLLAEHFSDEILTALDLNNQRGILTGVAVNTPGYGSRRVEILEDLAIYTGGHVVGENRGRPIGLTRVEDLGSAAAVVVERDVTLVHDGGGNPTRVSERIREIVREFDDSTSEYDREKLLERKSNLDQKAAVVMVGGSTEAERRRRVLAWRAAVRVGRETKTCVPGSGGALLLAQKAARDLKTEDPGENAGIAALADALEAPVRTLVQNLNRNADRVLAEIRTGGVERSCLDANTGELVALQDQHVLDALHVVLCALERAAESAATFCSASTWDLPNAGVGEE